MSREIKISNSENGTRYRSLTVAPASAGSDGKRSRRKKSKSKNVYRSRTLRSKKRSGFPIGIVLAIALVTVLLMMLVSDYVAVNEYTREVSKLNDTLDQLKKDEKKLSADYENKNDVIYMERYAAGQLGMVQSSDVEKRYIEIGQDENIEVYEVEDDGTMSEITSALFALTGNLVDSWNTLIGNE